MNLRVKASFNCRLIFYFFYLAQFLDAIFIILFNVNFLFIFFYFSSRHLEYFFLSSLHLAWFLMLMSALAVGSAIQYLFLFLHLVLLKPSWFFFDIKLIKVFWIFFLDVGLRCRARCWGNLSVRVVSDCSHHKLIFNYFNTKILTLKILNKILTIFF